MNVESIVDAMKRKLVEHLEDMGKDASNYEAEITLMGELLMHMVAKAAVGADVSNLAAQLAAVSANLASASQAIAVREIQEIIEDVLETTVKTVKEMIALAV
jgi:hypothetical protein